MALASPLEEEETQVITFDCPEELYIVTDCLYDVGVTGAEGLLL